MFEKSKALFEQKKAERAGLKVSSTTTIFGTVAAQYVGGYDEQKRPPGSLHFYKDHVEYHISLGMTGNGLILNNSEIASLNIDGKDEVSRRITATRLLTIGVFALAAQKKRHDKESYITFTLKDGRQVLFQNRKESPQEVKGKLINAISNISKTSSASDNDPAKEILKYSELRKQGAITEEEFQAKKRQLLGL